MGSFLNAHCPCGFEVNGRSIGVGMAMAPARQLARCDSCRTYVVVREGAGRMRCPNCRRKPQLVLLPGDYDYENERVASEAPRCPACDQTTIQFEAMGIWD